MTNLDSSLKFWGVGGGLKDPTLLYGRITHNKDQVFNGDGVSRGSAKSLNLSITK